MESDLQGAVAAVEVVQTRRVNELFVHTSQRLQREEKKNMTNRQTRYVVSVKFSAISLL